MTRRRVWPVIAALALGGCLCPGERFTETAYAEMASYGPEIAACIGRHACNALCAGVFQLGADVEIERCEITSIVRQDFTTQLAPIASSTDMRLVRGASLQVTYLELVPCDDSWDSWDDDGSDDGWDDGSDDDGSTDDGSTDDGSTDDGSTDDGSTDDGSTDDGSTDDGSSGLRARTPR